MSRLMREPQLTAGSLMPSPRYESVVSLMIKPGTLSAVLTMRRLAVCGMMCRKMMTGTGTPSMSASSTNSSRFIECTSPRIVLALPGQPTSAKISVIIMYDAPESMRAFRSERKKRIKYNPGMSMKNSARRIMLQSVPPPA